MAYPNSQLDAEKNPQTRCSNCQTVFEVSRELLSSSDTRVRCGECLSIFDALEELRTPEDLQNTTQNKNTGKASTHSNQDAVHQGSPSGTTDGAVNPLDVTYSDFDLFSDEADLPEIAYFDQTRDTPDFDFDSVDTGHDETFSDTLFVHDVTIDADATTIRPKATSEQAEPTASLAEIDFVADEVPREPLIFNYRDDRGQASDHNRSVDATPSSGATASTVSAASTTGTASAAVTIPQVPQTKPEQATNNTSNVSTRAQPSGFDRAPADLETTRNRSPWLFRVSMLLLLGLLLGGLFAYRTKPQLYNNPTIRPALEAGCKVLGCELPSRVAIDQLQMVKRNVYSHPNIPNALVVNVSFRNNAEFAQRLPLLHMVLTNRVGRTVAKRDFEPTAYMKNRPEKSTINAGEQLDITLEVSDPGRDAQSFEFYFREFE